MKTLSRNDYVILSPEVQEITYRYLVFGGERISYCSNIPNLDHFLISKTAKLLDNNGQEQYTLPHSIGTINAMMLEHLVNAQDISDVEILSKNDARYTPGVKNHVFYDSCSRIQVMHYPYRGMITSSKQENLHTLIAGSENSLITLMRMALKMAIVDHNKRNGWFALHAAAVSLNDNIYLILGGTHASKTTVFMNMVSNGYLPVNDDLVFLRYRKQLDIKSYRILPSIRKDSLRYIDGLDYQSVNESPVGFAGEYYFDVWSRYGVYQDALSNKKIAAILLPEYGFNNLEFSVADPVYATERIIKSLMGFQSLSANEDLLHVVNYLRGVPIVKLNLSRNMMGFVSKLNDHLSSILKND